MAVNRKLRKLYREIKDDPESRGYASMDAAGVLADLTEQRYEDSAEKWITDRTLDATFGMARSAEIMAALETAESGGSALAKRAKTLLNDRAGGGLDIGSSAAQSAVSDLVTAGIITSGEADQLTAMGVTKKSRGEKVGYSSLALVEVTRVLDAIAAEV